MTKKQIATPGFEFGGGAIFGNWGAGVVDDNTSPEQSVRNVERFVQDLVDAGHTVDSWEPMVEPSEDEEPRLMGGTRYSPVHDGRFPFRITVNGNPHILEMPGIPTEQVRYIDGTGQDIFDFPRIFLDGSSWTWDIGLRVITHADMGCVCPQCTEDSGG